MDELITILFLSTLPARGATICAFALDTPHGYFYPRSPRGERPGSQNPLPGRWWYFYPRSPRGERRAATHRCHRQKRFLSTLPARGATAGFCGCIAARWIFLSTLPARGATRLCGILAARFLFLSTLPARGATIIAHPPCTYLTFLSTLPARGATCDPHNIPDAWVISIHAPREGSDSDIASAFAGLLDFYPRSPRGERRNNQTGQSHDAHFYPRSPRGERPWRTAQGRPPRIFLSTLPARGATVLRGGDCGININFYPRSPRGERQHGSSRTKR